MPLDTRSCLIQQLIQRHTNAVQLHMIVHKILYIYYIISHYNHMRLLQISIPVLTILHTTVKFIYIHVYISQRCLHDNTASTPYRALQTIQQVRHIVHYRQYSKYAISCIADNTASTPYRALQTIQQVRHIVHYRQYSKYTISCITDNTASRPYRALQTIQQVDHIVHYRQYSKYTISCITDNTASTPYRALQTIQQVHHIVHYRQYSKYIISCTTASIPHYAYITEMKHKHTDSNPSNVSLHGEVCTNAAMTVSHLFLQNTVLVS